MGILVTVAMIEPETGSTEDINEISEIELFDNSLYGFKAGEEFVQGNHKTFYIYNEFQIKAINLYKAVSLQI